ncbi:MAG TPA: ROK family transcriptional regulator [Propionibacteriaceae bacterium]
MASPIESIRDEPGPGSQSSLRAANEHRIVTALRTAGPLTQAELARRTSLAPSTVSGIVSILAERGIVRAGDEPGGRKGRLIHLDLEDRYVLGVELGNGHLSLALATLSSRVVDFVRRPQALGASAETTLDLVEALLGRMLEAAGASRADLVRGGVAVPAPLDVRGVLSTSPLIFPSWAGIDIATLFTDRFGFPFAVDNDANLGALADYLWGAGQGSHSMVFVGMNYGFGAGIVLEGTLFHGATGVSGEIGHTTVDENGEFCQCGNRGCLNTIASINRALELLAPIHPEIDSAEKLLEAAEQGLPPAIRVLTDMGRASGVAIANVVNLLNPEVIVIGGDLTRAGEVVTDPMITMAKRLSMPAASGVRLQTTPLGERVFALGGIALALGLNSPHSLLLT